MSERFIFKNAYPFYRGECIFDSKENKFIIETEEVINVLNSLNEKNKSLQVKESVMNMDNNKIENRIEHYDYDLLNTHYEAREDKIIEWNRHSSNAEYFSNDLKGIEELLNIKQMKLEGIMDYNMKMGKLLDKIEKLEKSNEELNISINLFEDDIIKKDNKIKQLQKQLDSIQNKSKNEKRFVLCKKGDVEYIEDNGCVQLYGFDVICEMLNELQSEIRLYQERVNMREEQISIIKKHCLELLSDEQIKLIRNNLENLIKDKVKSKFSVTGDENE